MRCADGSVRRAPDSEHERSTREGSMVGNKNRAGVRLSRAVLAAAMACPAAAFAAREWNLQPPVTPVARQMFDLHTFIFWACVVIFVAVFSVMFYSIFKHRKSVGHKAHQFHENATVEVVWTVIPFLILLFMAFPATRTVLALKDTSEPGLTVKVTGYQWKWNYDYLQEGVSFYSNLAMPMVVEVVSKDAYAQWIGDRKKEAAAAGDDPNKVWDVKDLAARGEKVYMANCAACHQPTGKCAPPAFPPLDGSKIVNGPKAEQIKIVLNGVERDGKPTAMVSWKQLSDTDIAAVITYTRNSWGNHTGEAVQPSEIKAAR